MLGDILLEMNLVSETQLAQALSIRLKVPFVDLASIKVDGEAVQKIPEGCCGYGNHSADFHENTD